MRGDGAFATRTSHGAEPSHRTEAGAAALQLCARLLRMTDGASGEGPGIVLIDGRSGSGKTSIASALAAALRLSGRTVVALAVEHLYPGWDGLAEGSAALPRALDRGEYRRYDWTAGEFAEVVPLADPAHTGVGAGSGADSEPPVLIVEGCGALSAASIAAAGRWHGRTAAATQRVGGSFARDGREFNRAVWGVWVECPDEDRKRRALERDGEMFRPHWERWARQEEALFAVTRPRSLAHEIVHMD